MMDKPKMIELLKEIEKDIYVSSLESTFLQDSKSCAIHEAIEMIQNDSGKVPDPEKLQVFFDKDFSKSLDALRESFVKSIDIINQALRQQFKDAVIIRNVTTPESAKTVVGKILYSNRLSYPEQKAMAFALKGIEKMIPRNVLYEYDGYYDGEPVCDQARCPECDLLMDDTEDDWKVAKYCPECGQAISWEMEEVKDE